MHHRPPAPLNDFGPIKNENLLYKLYVLRELRLALQAAVASKWVWLTFSLALALGVSASWMNKTHWFL